MIMANGESFLNDEPITKPFWLSKEFWIGVIGILIPILSYYGIIITDEQIAVYAEMIVIILMTLTRLFSTKTKLVVK